jgi:hypothetical protein
MTPEQALAVLGTKADADFPNAALADEVTEAEVARLVEAGRKTSGRPSLTAPGERSPQITLRLPRNVDQRLSDVAAASGRRRSQVVREALDQYLKTA